MTDNGGIRTTLRAFRSGANGAPAITPRHTKQFARSVEFIINYSCGLLPQAALKNGVHRKELCMFQLCSDGKYFSILKLQNEIFLSQELHY